MPSSSSTVTAKRRKLLCESFNLPSSPLLLPSPFLKIPPELRQAILAETIELVTILPDGTLIIGDVKLYLVCQAVRQDLLALRESWLGSTVPSNTYLRCVSPRSLLAVPFLLSKFAENARKSKREWAAVNLEVCWFDGDSTEVQKLRKGQCSHRIEDPVHATTAKLWTTRFGKDLPTGEDRNYLNSPLWTHIKEIRFNVKFILENTDIVKPYVPRLFTVDVSETRRRLEDIIENSERDCRRLRLEYFWLSIVFSIGRHLDAVFGVQSHYMSSVSCEVFTDIPLSYEKVMF